MFVNDASSFFSLTTHTTTERKRRRLLHRPFPRESATKSVAKSDEIRDVLRRLFERK